MNIRGNRVLFEIYHIVIPVMKMQVGAGRVAVTGIHIILRKKFPGIEVGRGKKTVREPLSGDLLRCADLKDQNIFIAAMA
jgi:hypothetical protein